MIRAVVVVVALALAGCGDHRIVPDEQPPRPKPAAKPWPKLPHCPNHAANCASARGTIVYVEAVDPDGDGDAHFILTSTQSITAPGVSVIDVEKSLRPHPLPRIGDRVAAAGPVYPGSHGQKQIQATVLRVQR